MMNPVILSKEVGQDYRIISKIYRILPSGYVKLKIALALSLLLTSTGCIVVGGYSSERGWFIWPGTFVLLLVGVALFWLFNRRR